MYYLTPAGGYQSGSGVVDIFSPFVDILTVGNLDVDILNVGNLDDNILNVGNLDVDIFKVRNLDVDIFKEGNLDVDIGTYVEQQNSVVSESIGLRRCGT
jgi:hypothetical protein